MTKAKLNQREELMKALDFTKDIVAAFTGVKQQFMDAGWSPEAAEQMTIQMYKAGTSNAATEEGGT